MTACASSSWASAPGRGSGGGSSPPIPRAGSSGVVDIDAGAARRPWEPSPAAVGGATLAEVAARVAGRRRHPRARRPAGATTRSPPPAPRALPSSPRSRWPTASATAEAHRGAGRRGRRAAHGRPQLPLSCRDAGAEGAVRRRPPRPARLRPLHSTNAGATGGSRTSTAIRSRCDQPMLWEQSIHHFDLMRFVYDAEPVPISARTWNPPWSMYRGDANVAALITFASGIEVTYQGTWAGEPATADFNWRTDCAARHRRAGRHVRRARLCPARRPGAHAGRAAAARALDRRRGGAFSAISSRISSTARR